MLSFTPSPEDSAAASSAERGRPRLVFADVYRDHVGFVWRSVRGLGVSHASVDDLVQEVFVTVDRRLADFEGRSSVKAWLSGITLNVVRHHRRSVRRKSPHETAAGEGEIDPHSIPSVAPTPYEAAVQAEQTRLLERILDELDEEKREVLVLAELEEMSVPDIAAALDIKLNTAYSRLRLAREAFERSLARHRMRDERRAR